VSDCELKVEEGGEWARADMMAGGMGGLSFCSTRKSRLSIKDKALERTKP
jgi:hypothetical protein